MSVFVIATNSTTQSNITGAGADYTINWDGSVEDPFGFFSDNKIHFNSKTTCLVSLYLKLSGLSVLNTELDVILNTSDGDIEFFSGNPSGLLLSSSYNAALSRIITLNPTNNESYDFNIKIQVSNGLTNAVDILSGSYFSIMY